MLKQHKNLESPSHRVIHHVLTQVGCCRVVAREQQSTILLSYRLSFIDLRTTTVCTSLLSLSAPWSDSSSSLYCPWQFWVQSIPGRAVVWPRLVAAEWWLVFKMDPNWIWKKARLTFLLKCEANTRNNKKWQKWDVKLWKPVNRVRMDFLYLICLFAPSDKM